MKWSSVASAVLLVAGAGVARAADGSDLARWQWVEEILTPAKPVKGHIGIVLPPAVLGKARPDLSDLRVVDGAGKLVPHALRVLREEYQQTPVPVKQRFDEDKGEGGRYRQVRLELAVPGELKHNEIEILTPGSKFRRRVVVAGADRADFKEPLTLVDDFLLNWQAEGRAVSFHKFRYEPKSYRYVQVRVYPDGSEALPKIGQVTVRHTVAVKGEEVTRQANLGPRQAVRGDGGPGSAWFLDLGERVPVSRILLEADERGVVRPFRLEVVSEERREPIAGADWRWGKVDGREVLQIDFPEVTARRLRLVVTDFANPPLNLRTAKDSAAVREIVFQPEGRERPLRLYYGNPDADPPHYDEEPALRKAAVAQRVQLGNADRNPGYQPPPQPLGERAPWLVYLVLTAASLTLLGLLVLLARKATARHDATAPTPPEGGTGVSPVQG